LAGGMGFAPKFHHESTKDENTKEDKEWFVFFRVFVFRAFVIGL
jgi:hypothetical protein